MTGLFAEAIIKPIYNGFAFFIGVAPGGSVGVAIILTTLLVRIVLLPLSHKASLSQVKMRALAPELEAIRKKHAKNKEEQAKKTFELYRQHKLNPFSSCVSIIIQIPIILGLFYVFFKYLPQGINPEYLYKLVLMPDSINLSFLGIFDLKGKSIILAGLAATAQFFQLKYMSPVPTPGDKKEKGTLAEELLKNMTKQMRYTLPVVVFVGAHYTSAAVALYWTTSNLFSFGHEWYVRKKVEREGLKKAAHEQH